MNTRFLLFQAVLILTAKDALVAQTAPITIQALGSQTSRLSPGMLISIQAEQLSPVDEEAETTPLPTVLANVQVLLDSRAIPLHSVRRGEIIAQLPWDTTTGAHTIVVRRPGSPDTPRVAISLLRASPGIVTDGLNSSAAVFQNNDGRFNADTQPAISGSTGILYAVGLGPVDSATRIGPGAVSPAGARATLPIQVTIGGLRADNIAASLIEGILPVYRIQLRVPPGLGYGSLQASVTVDGVTSNIAELVIFPGGRPTRTVCSRAILDERGNPAIPRDAVIISNAIEQSNTETPVHQAYPNVDTGTEEFYQTLKYDSNGCPLTVDVLPLPPAVLDPDLPPTPDESTVAAGNQAIDAVATQSTQSVSTTTGPDEMVRIVSPNFLYARPLDPCLNQAPGTVRFVFCQSLQSSPFGGKDVIYVHGLDQDALERMVQGVVYPTWSDANKTTFINHFQDFSDSMWQPQINAYLKNGAGNRYVTVGWSTMSRMEYGVNAVLFQIAAAMVSGSGVKLASSADFRGTSGFCARGCVVISHSTGGAIVDIAMAKARDSAYQASYGPIAFIPSMIRTHVATAGAINGSQLATAAIAAASGVTAGCSFADALLPGNGFNGSFCNIQPAFLDSVLMDLMPAYNFVHWRPWIEKTPVPTLTVSGGDHAYVWLAKVLLHRGLDDGVVSTDSSCARTYAFPFWPGGTTPLWQISQFDRGLFATGQQFRAFQFYFDQMGLSNSQLAASAGCTPFKTPWGMLFTPANDNMHVSRTFLPNHYAFLQTAEHHRSIRSMEDSFREDVRAIKDDTVYSLNLVDPALKQLQVQDSIGHPIVFTYRGTTHIWWIWRRLYHRLAGWQNQPIAHYVYKYVK